MTTDEMRALIEELKTKNVFLGFDDRGVIVTVGPRDALDEVRPMLIAKGFGPPERPAPRDEEGGGP